MPEESKTYTVKCKGNLSACDGQVEIIVDKKCSGVIATAKPTQINYGESVLLSVNGCSEDIKWHDEQYLSNNVIGDKKNMFVHIGNDKMFTVSCKDKSGNLCYTETEQVRLNCDLQLAVSSYYDFNNNNPLLLTTKKTKEVTIQGIGCSDGVKWEYNLPKNVALKAIENNSIIFQNVVSSFELTASCFSGACTKKITIKPPKENCYYGRPKILNDYNGFDNTNRTEPINLKVETLEDKGVVWLDENLYVRDRIVPIPTKPIVYTVAEYYLFDDKQLDCTNQVAFNPPAVIKKSAKILNDCIKFTISANPPGIDETRGNAIVYLTASGCTNGLENGTIIWNNDPTKTGEVLKVAVDKSTTYTATCTIGTQRIEETITINKVSYTKDPINQLPIGLGIDFTSPTNIKPIPPADGGTKCDKYPISLTSSSHTIDQDNTIYAQKGTSINISAFCEGTIKWRDVDNPSNTVGLSSNNLTTTAQGYNPYQASCYVNNEKVCNKTLIVRVVCNLSAKVVDNVLSVDGCSSGNKLFYYKNNGTEWGHSEDVNLIYKIECRNENHLGVVLCKLENLNFPSNRGLRTTDSANGAVEIVEGGCIKIASVTTKTFVNAFLKNSLCGNLETLEGDKKIILETLRAKLLEENINLPEITDQMAADLNAGKCEEVVNELTKDITGTESADVLRKIDGEEIVSEVIDNYQNNFAISLSNPDINTTAKTYKIGQYSVTFYIDVEKVGDYYQMNGKQYTPLYYAGSRGFIGFYDKDILATITPNEKGEYPKGVLDSKGAWLLPSATTYKVESYQTLVETTIPTLQSDFLEPFATYWKALHKCTDTEFKAYEEGIVPECFWHGVGNPNFAQLAGLIDETYRTGVGFGKFTKPTNKIDDLLREYLLGITCEDELWDNIKKIDKLEDEIRKLNYDAEIINFVVEQWKNEQIETLAEDIDACNEYVNFKQKLPQFADIVLNWDTWATTFENLPDNIDKYVETFAKDLYNVGTLNDLQNYALGKRMFEVGSIFATAGGANAAERGINVLKSLPKLPNGLALKIEETIGEVGIKVFIEGETEVFFSIGKGGVYTSSRWYTGSNVTTVLEELTNIHYIDAAGTSKTGTVQIIQDAAGNKWFKVAGTVSRYANYPNIQKLATHILDELLWDDAILSSLESDLGKSTLKQALEGDLDLLYLWQTSKQTTLANLTLLKNQLQKIGYSDFKTIDFLKNADGTYYGNKLIYADPSVTAEDIIKGSPNELAFLEEICNRNSTKAYTPVSTKQAAIDGVLAFNNELVQLKTNSYGNMIGYINDAYTSANNANIKGVHLYMEITDVNSSVSSVVSKWRTSAPSSNVKIINNGTISTITVKTNTGWVDLDLTLIK